MQEVAFASISDKMRTVKFHPLAPTEVTEIRRCCVKCKSSSPTTISWYGSVHTLRSSSWAVTFGIIAFVAGFALPPVAGNFVQIQLSLNRSCDDWAVLRVKLPEVHLDKGKMCRATYRPFRSSTFLQVELNPTNRDRLVSLGSLGKKTTYVVHMACGENLQSNNLTFVTGSRCSMAVSDDPEVQTAPAPMEDDELIHSSIRDTILGIFIAVVGIVIAAVVLYYLYKNHRRRQRILRIFRHNQSDPFETLQDHMEEASSSSL